MDEITYSRKPIITAQEATLGYAKKIALTHLTLTIHEGEFVGIIGPNGSGKTTLLKGILGLLPPLSGALQVFDCACEKMRCYHRAQIGYVPQKGFVDPDYPITAWEVALMGRYSTLGLLRRPAVSDRAIVGESLAAVGMSSFSDLPFGSLSFGQQQRVLIARALAQRPKMLLLDEPTTGIDAAAEQQLMDLIGHLHKIYRLTILFVTHDINTISRAADTLILLNGRLIGQGRPETVLTPEHLTLVYGTEIIIAKRDQKPYVILNDAHRPEVHNSP